MFDAKNHLVFPIKGRYFVDDAGRAYITNESFRSNLFRVFLENTLRFFKVDPDAHLDSFPQPTTPFVFVTREVDRMIKYIEEREQAPFPSVFMAADIAEFFCYSAYMIFVAGLMDSNYTYRPSQSRVIWAQSKGANSVSAIIEQTEKLGLPVFAVHRRALVGMPKPSINMIGGFWARRGLFPDKDAALRFLIRQAAIERRAYHLKQLRGLKRRLKRAVRGAAV